MKDANGNDFDHPCKETCSGWLQGFERGREGTVPGVIEAMALIRMLAERDKYKAALEWIARKSPHEVSREEAADMACEFKLLAEEALK